MSIKAYQRSVSKIEYVDSCGFANSSEDFKKFLKANGVVSGLFIDESWEIPAGELEDVINNIKNTQDNEIAFKSGHVEYSYGNVRKTIKNWIKNNKENAQNLDIPDFIIIDWF